MCPKKYWPWRFIVKFLILSFIVPVPLSPSGRLVPSLSARIRPAPFYALASGLAKSQVKAHRHNSSFNPIPAPALFCLSSTPVSSISGSTTRWTWRCPIRDRFV